MAPRFRKRMARVESIMGCIDKLAQAIQSLDETEDRIRRQHELIAELRSKADVLMSPTSFCQLCIGRLRL